MTARIQTSRPADHVLAITLARAEKRNAFDQPMLRELAEAFTELDEDSDLRCGVVLADGDHFTAGLELSDVGPAVAAGEALFPEGAVDPLGLHGRIRTKPIVIGVQGWVLTLGIELLLAADIRLAADDARFGQIEVKRGIFPFGGATIRFPQVCGWGNAQRYLLTGDVFDAPEALRIGLVQEVVPPAELAERATALAATVARQAPLAVQASLRSSRLAVEEGQAAALEVMMSDTRAIMASEDAAEGMQSFVERRDARFQGK
ncbi:MAG: enoyl-CoA hydratase [Sandaracinus sp.]|nr:enoyl-CoA hydratase [Sandaracinus sp.]|tara:strand:+ start:1038 stop:1820 length:783 start_codon:yes stop_codon:yes gene_type:complete